MAHILRVQAIVLGKMWRQEHVAAGRVAPMVRSSVWLLSRGTHSQEALCLTYTHITRISEQMTIHKTQVRGELKIPRTLELKL